MPMTSHLAYVPLTLLVLASLCGCGSSSEPVPEDGGAGIGPAPTTMRDGGVGGSCSAGECDGGTATDAAPPPVTECDGGPCDGPPPPMQCTGRWTGPRCDRCPQSEEEGSWDPDRDCNACLPGYSQPDCTTCRVFVDQNSPTADGDGSSWQQATTTLGEGLRLARRGALLRYTTSCEVWVAAGRYHPHASASADEEVDRHATFLLEGENVGEEIHLYGGFRGGEPSLSDRELVESTETVLDGEIPLDTSDVGPDAGAPPAPRHVYHVVTLGQGAVLDGFTVRGGRADGEGTDGNGGGAVSRFAENVEIRNTHFRDNRANEYGGGLFLQVPSRCTDEACDTAILERATFANNHAEQNGGAVALSYVELDVSHVTIVDNDVGSSGVGRAGGLFAMEEAKAEIADGILYYNAEGQVADDNAIINVSRSLISDTAFEDDGNLSNVPRFSSGGRGVWDLRLTSWSPCTRPADDDCGAFEYVPCAVRVSKSGSAEGDGRTWDAAYDSVHAALDAAEARVAAPDDGVFTCDVWIAAGTYYPTRATEPDGQPSNDRQRSTFRMRPGVGVYGGFAGDEMDLSDLDRSGACPGWELRTVLSGDLAAAFAGVDAGAPLPGEKAYHVVWGSSHSLLEGVEVTGGDAAESPEGTGGGLYATGDDILLRQVAFVENVALAGGGVSSERSIAVEDALFEGNGVRMDAELIAAGTVGAELDAQGLLGAGSSLLGRGDVALRRARLVDTLLQGSSVIRADTLSMADSLLLQANDAAAAVDVPDVAVGQTCDVTSSVIAGCRDGDGCACPAACSCGDEALMLYVPPPLTDAYCRQDATLVATGLVRPYGIAVDDETLYVCERVSNGGGLSVVDKGGGVATRIVDGTGGEIVSVTLDDDYAYYTDWTPGAIVRLDKAAPTTTAVVLASGLQLPVDMEVEGDVLYFTEFSSAVDGSNLQRLDLTMAPLITPVAVATGLPEGIGGLALDGSTFLLGRGNVGLLRFTAGADATTWDAPEELVVDGSYPVFVELDDGYVYWGDQTDRIQRWNEQDGQVESYFRRLNASQTYGVAVDEDWLYYSDFLNGAVWRIAKDLP